MPRHHHANDFHRCPGRQRGAALMVMLVIMIMGSAAFLVSSLSRSGLQTERSQKTAEALVQAKEALIGYAASASTPGKLPCPEDILLIGTPNEGQALGSCSNALPVIGRLPWRTLGLGDLRDGNGDKLWYVLSAGFRNSPINSDTPAQLTVDGIPNAAVAIIFSPGTPINGQSRPIPTAATPPVITQYLELSNNDGDNTFTNSGPADTFNDRLLLITHNDLFRVVEKRVAKEVTNALNEYYCGFGNVNPSGGCIAACVNCFYPHPADFTDNSCLGNADISSVCNSGATNRGRIPSNLATAWDATSILRGYNSGNWFQANAWREVIFYAVATACTDGTSNCNGAGYLTLNNPAGTALTNQKVVVIAAGSTLPTTTPAQTRSSAGNKTNINNYLEDENLVPPDDVYTKSASSPTIPFNDIAISIP